MLRLEPWEHDLLWTTLPAAMAVRDGRGLSHAQALEIAYEPTPMPMLLDPMLMADADGGSRTVDGRKMNDAEVDQLMTALGGKRVEKRAKAAG